MSTVNIQVVNGSRQVRDGRECVYYDGYWIRYYAPPKDTLPARKRLIDHLTRRIFHQTEAGINTPGERLEQARAAHQREQDPARKRVNGAMLAGALIKRAADIFTTVVELEQRGVVISPNNELMRQCGEYFREALELGKAVKHYSGEEGIDELWGEPLKAFTMPIEGFYESRYLKIAQTCRDIDLVTKRLAAVFSVEPAFAGLGELLCSLGEAAKFECETLRSDPAIFHVWPEFVASSEALLAFRPQAEAGLSDAGKRRLRDAVRLIRRCANLLSYLASARVSMPKSTAAFLGDCETFPSTG